MMPSDADPCLSRVDWRRSLTTLTLLALAVAVGTALLTGAWWGISRMTGWPA